MVFAGNGDGTFHMIGTGINLNPLGGVLSYVTVSDFNGDGNADVAVTLDNSSTHVFFLTIYTGNGDGTFRTGATYTGHFLGAPAVSDFNGDGKLDIAVTDTTDNAVDVLAGNGDGTFQNAVPWNAGFSPQVLAVGDFNGDGRADILSSLILNINDLTGNQFTVLLGSAAATVPQITTTSLPVATVGVSYSATLSATRGVPPYSNWTVSSGSLPSGLTLATATGVVSGVPTVAAASAFSATVQDSAGDLSPGAFNGDRCRRVPPAPSSGGGPPPAVTLLPVIVSTLSPPVGTTGTPRTSPDPDGDRRRRSTVHLGCVFRLATAWADADSFDRHN